MRAFYHRAYNPRKASVKPSVKPYQPCLNCWLRNDIAVDFLGEADDVAAYRYLLELLDEEIDDIRIPGMTTRFICSSPEYDAVMWIEHSPSVKTAKSLTRIEHVCYNTLIAI